MYFLLLPNEFNFSPNGGNGIEWQRIREKEKDINLGHVKNQIDDSSPTLNPFQMFIVTIFVLVVVAANFFVAKKRGGGNRDKCALHNLRCTFNLDENEAPRKINIIVGCGWADKNCRRIYSKRSSWDVYNWRWTFAVQQKFIKNCTPKQKRMRPCISFDIFVEFFTVFYANNM